MKLGLSGWKKRSVAGAAEAAGLDAATSREADAAAVDSSDASVSPAGDAPHQPAPVPASAWDEMTSEPVSGHVPVRGDSVVIDDPNTEPGGLYIQERVLTSAITPVHIATHDRPAERRVESIERAAQAARLLVCDIQECSDNAEPLVAYALGSITRDASRVAVELQSVLAAMKKAP